MSVFTITVQFDYFRKLESFQIKQPTQSWETRKRIFRYILVISFSTCDYITVSFQNIVFRYLSLSKTSWTFNSDRISIYLLRKGYSRVTLNEKLSWIHHESLSFVKHTRLGLKTNSRKVEAERVYAVKIMFRNFSAQSWNRPRSRK